MLKAPACSQLCSQLGSQLGSQLRVELVSPREVCVNFDEDIWRVLRQALEDDFSFLPADSKRAAGRFWKSSPAA